MYVLNVCMFNCPIGVNELNRRPCCDDLRGAIEDSSGRLNIDDAASACFRASAGAIGAAGLN